MEELKQKLKQEIESYVKCDKILKIEIEKYKDEILFLEENNKMCYGVFGFIIEKERSKKGDETIKPLSDKLNSHAKDIRVTAKILEELIGLKETIKYCSECFQISKNTESA